MIEVPDEYISGRILKNPKVINGKIIRGAIILSQLDYVVETLPKIKDYFYTIERRGWRGLNESKHADIKLVEDLSFWNETIEKFPNAICLDMGPADFVDTDSFYPLREKKKYIGIQISSWDNFKRPFIFISACALLPHRNFIKLGHFVRKGNLEEIAVRNQCLELTKKSGAKIDYPYGNLNDNELMPKSKEEVNRLINSASMGILTSNIEGINRFKMECLAANVPFLVSKDAAYPTKKHINESTGILFEPTPEGLAKAIEELNNKLGSMKPREYILKNTGKKISSGKLREALRKLTKRDNQEFNFEDIEWDGRNESLIWGRKKLFAEIERGLNDKIKGSY
ncbi:MAG: glycosyltransferase [Nanoarchaeota archaeon]|nr:glycosyltransferase [Nanoarchaeota archaeon]